MKKILLLTDFSSEYGRNLLQGVVRYAKEHGPWVFYRMPLYYRKLHGDKGVVEWAKKWKPDAIIAQLADLDLDLLSELKVPIIVQNYKDRNKLISNLTGDYFQTGVMAADFFIVRGYRHFAYYGFEDTVWMRERGRGFKERIEKIINCTVHCFTEKETTVEEDGKWDVDARQIRGWLKRLPKPIALFACDDFFALQITEACKMCEIAIPDDIAILGVDNDDLLCNISDPPLSSIELDVKMGGYKVGELLDEFIKKEKEPPVDIIINPMRIVLRQSTDRFSVSDKYLKRILEYIEQNYMQPLSVEDIIELVPFSRRVLEKKFKATTKMTIYQYVQQIRVNRFAELLITTDFPLIQAATMAGFEDYKNTSRTFIQKKGMSPLQYRKKFTGR